MARMCESRIQFESKHKNVLQSVTSPQNVKMSARNAGDGVLNHAFSDSKVPGANMGLTWGRQEPGGP